ncbi:MAG: hypothetical protein ACRCUM_00210 [Mycoplasmoidaceae bacterium]
MCNDKINKFLVDIPNDFHKETKNNELYLKIFFTIYNISILYMFSLKERTDHEKEDHA